jgi:DNA primase
MSLPPGFLDELRGRTSLARVVGRKVAWDSRKSNASRGDFWASCPFHQEKTASFHVDEAKGFYHCFGCHASGDAISFLRESENLGFLEAVEQLAQEAGMPMPARGAAAGPADDRRGRLHAAMEAAFGFYRLQLGAARGAEARAYLDRRGVTPAARERFEIGFAPREWTALSEHLGAKGFSAEEMAAAGLTGASADGRRAYDRFRNRIVFPIRDGRGCAIALGGRTLETAGDAPKYLNSPETALFDKGRTLFNLRGARAAAGKTGQLMVAEGYMDVVALAQAGFEAAVAPLGTAITEGQLEQIWAVAAEPLVALDGDAAGLAAAQRLIDLALPRLAAGRSLRFVLLPPGHDPDDVLRAGGAAAMQALIDASEPIVELLWRRETEGQRLDSPERRAALDARLKACLGRIGDEGLRAHWAAALRERRSRLFAPPPRAPAAPFGAWGGRPPARGARAARAAAGGPTAAAKASLLAQAGGRDMEARLRESAILLGLINQPALLPAFEDRLDRMSFVCPDLAEIRDAILSLASECLPLPAEAGALPALPEEATSVAREPAPRSDDLAERIAHKLGFDPRGRLRAIGHVRANPHLQAGADQFGAATAVEEEMIRHAAWMEQQAELQDAIRTLGGDGADEGLTWRLRAAADAQERAARDPLTEEAALPEDSAALSRSLQEMIDREVWKKRRRGR